MSVEEMESALTARFSKRMQGPQATGGPPLSARALLEENRQLIEDKQQRKALARKNSREFVEQLLQLDQMSIEGDKARALGRRHAQRELAQYYKAKIAEKEDAKVSQQRSKRKGEAEAQHFPFVEGETIIRQREAKSAQLREEMRAFLEKQRQERPPRADSLKAESSVTPQLLYPISPVSSALGHGASAMAAAAGAPPGAMGEEVAPHMARYPRFLSRAREHMSRRLQDSHVRKALEEKVEQTKQELEQLSRQRQVEARQWEESLLVGDAVQQDSARTKAQERRRHAEFLRAQMQERQERQRREREEHQHEAAGYWGPEEKEAQSEEFHRAHCEDLIKQMQVDQLRRLSSRDQRLRQERRLIDNCVAELSQDRERDRQKQVLHREVLRSTWDSQLKIREAVKSIGAL